MNYHSLLLVKLQAYTIFSQNPTGKGVKQTLIISFYTTNLQYDEFSNHQIRGSKKTLPYRKRQGRVFLEPRI